VEDEPRLVELMIAYQAGEAAAFAQLYSRLGEEIRRHFARSQRDPALTRDLVQDLFLEVHRSRRSYSPPLPVRPWIYGIARNVAARQRRARSGEAHVHGREAVPDSVSSGELSPAEALDVENAVTALPASTREPWLLHHVAGLSFDSIAARLGISVVAAKLRSSRATRALRVMLGDRRIRK
jgi:RNA polymerase sigma-70 factor (ECF subfamily)